MDIRILSVVFIFFLLKCSNNKTVEKGYKNPEKSSKIDLSNNGDSLKGFVFIINDSLFFSSNWDINNRDSLCSDENVINYSEPYFLFSFSMGGPHASKKHLCEYHPKFGSLDDRNLKNTFYPPIKIDDSMYLVKHIANIYNQKPQNIREFIIDSNLNIVSFRSEKASDSLYFFYD